MDGDDELTRRLRSLMAERLRPTPAARPAPEGLTWASVVLQRRTALAEAVADDDEDDEVVP